MIFFDGERWYRGNRRNKNHVVDFRFTYRSNSQMFSFNLWTSSNWTLSFTCFSDRPKLPFHLMVVTGAMPDGCKGMALNSDPPIPTWRIIPVVNNHGRLVSPHKDRVVGPPSLHGHSHGLSMTGKPQLKLGWSSKYSKLSHGFFSHWAVGRLRWRLYHQNLQKRRKSQRRLPTDFRDTTEMAAR